MSARELRKFLLEPGYVINAGFGSFMMIALGVAAIVKGGDLLKAVGEMFVDAPAGTDFVQRFTAPAAVAVTLLMSSMTTVSILSVSTDGNTYWLLQSSPVTSRQVFLSKITPHLLFNVIPGEFLCIAGCIAFRAGLLQSLIAVIMVFLYSYVTAAIGYVIDIKRPKLDWTDITVAIKQNVNVLIAMAAGFVLALIAGGLGFVLSIFIHPALALLIASIPLIALAVAFKFIGSNCWKPAQNN